MVVGDDGLDPRRATRMVLGVRWPPDGIDRF
jgi:hypothetical protein